MGNITHEYQTLGAFAYNLHPLLLDETGRFSGIMECLYVVSVSSIRRCCQHLPWWTIGIPCHPTPTHQFSGNWDSSFLLSVSPKVGVKSVTGSKSIMISPMTD